MRLFLAIELPSDVRHHVAGVARELLAAWPTFDLEEEGYRLSWVRPENLHATIKFLGEVADDRLPALTAALDRVSLGGACELMIDRAECLPPQGFVRVVGVGLGGDAGRLQHLHHAIEDACEEVGFSREHRAFRPHVTLCRARRPLPRWTRDDFQELIERRLPGPPFVLERFTLFESHLKPTGPEYVRVGQWKL